MSKLQDKISALRKELSDFDVSVQNIIDAQQEGLMWSLEMACKIKKEAEKSDIFEKTQMLQRLTEIDAIQELRSMLT